MSSIKNETMSKTEKLYDTDGHLHTFHGTLLYCDKVEDYYELVLDRTAFFPEGGGQSADTGVIGDSEVFDARIEDGIIYHKCRKGLDVGREYICSIDREQRLRRMQNHSGEHLVSGLIYRYHGFDNVGFHMGHEDITLDTDGYLSENEVRQIEYLANVAVAENKPITSFYPTTEELQHLEYRCKKELTGDIRIVKIEGYDACACCAPHLAFTGEIGIVKIFEIERNKGGTRIHMLCGLDALDDYRKRYGMISDIARKLSVKQDALGIAVEKLEAEIAALKDKNYHLKTELFEYKIAGIEPTDGNILIFEEDIPPNDMRKIMNSVLPVCGGICAVLCGNDNIGYRFTATSKSADLGKLAAELREGLSAKCGGGSDIIQGSIPKTKNEIEKFFGV